MKLIFAGIVLSALGPLAALHAAEAPKPDVKVTQELLNSIHVTPRLILDPFPAYAEKYLPFAMAASMESTPKGRLWTCWAGGQDGPNAYLLASYSDDGGESWRDPVFVIDPQAHGLKMGTRLGSFWCDPKGRLWLFFHQSVGMFDGSCSNWFVRCDDPDAEKPVWTEPVSIGFGASLNKPIVRKNGEWILPVSLWERWHIDKPFADRYRELDAVRGANVFVSDDEGASWRYRGGIIFKDSCFNEHSVVERADGRLWMLSRGMKEAFQSFSSDGGATWAPQATFFPHVNSKAAFRRLQSGNLLLVKHGQDMATSPERKGPSDGGVRKDLTAYLSRDDGKTWSKGLLLDERGGVSYPDIAQAPNGDIYVHYDRDRSGAAEILFARFREEDVLAGKLVNDNAALKKLVKSRQHGMQRRGAEKASAVEAVPAIWDPGVPLPKASALPQVRGVELHVLKPRGPDVDGCRWTLGVGLCWHKGRLYASYGFNKGDENTPTEEAHARVSDDGGKTWGPAVVMDAGAGDLGVSHGVFLSQGGRLWAFMGAFYGRFERTHTRAYVLDEASGHWEPRGVVVGDGFWPMQEPQRMADGNWIMAGFRAAKGYGVAGNQPAVAISHGDDFTKWDLVVIPVAAEHQKNLWGESTVIVEGTNLTNIARYGAKPLALVSTSDDAGRTWTPATASNLPMATSKPYAGILSTGQRYLVCTTTADSGGRRSPLTIAVSRPGETRFSAIYRIRDSVCDATPGVSHPKADMSYPYAVEHEGKLYVGYTQKSHQANELAVIPIDEFRAYERENLRRVADLALIPPVPNTEPLPQYDYDKLDYGMTIGIERTPKGRLWACWVAGGDSPKAFFVLATSDDDGETWSKPRLVLDSHSSTLPRDRSILVGNLWTDPRGRLWLFFDQSMEMFDGRGGVWATVCENPDAEKPAWSAPRRIWHGVMLNKPTVLSTGEWMLPISLDQRDGTHPAERGMFGPFQGLFPELDPFRGANVFVSTDEGATWQRRGGVAFPNPDWHEHMIVERRDKSLWMLARTTKGIMQSASTDGGRTWATPTEPPGIRQPNARFHVRRLASGKLLLVKHGDRIDAHEGRVKLSAWLSGDDGATWQGGLVLDERPGISYPDGFQAPDGTISISYDRNRATDGEILLARFTEADVLAKKLSGPKSKLKMLISRPLAPRPAARTPPHSRAADATSILPAGWNPKAAADAVLARLVRISAPQVKGAHDAEFVCVGDRAYVVEHDNDVEPGHGAGKAMYCVLTVVNLKTLSVEKTHLLAKAGQQFANAALPDAEIFVPRIIRKDEHTLRCWFCSQPADTQAVTWYRDFDLRTQSFAETIHKAKLKTASGTFDMEPRHLHADAVAGGFTKPPVRRGLYIFDSFKEFDGRRYVALNNFEGKQNALAVLLDDFATFEVIGHYNEPQAEQLSESAVNRLPDGTWMAICRNDKGNYHFTTSRDGGTWTVGTPRPLVPNGLNSKPTFERFGGVYHLGWQENTKVADCQRSVFNIDVSRDGKTWERKYRFESPHSFQYPTFHEHEGTIWLAVTQSDHKGSSDRIMFGRLEDLATRAGATTTTTETESRRSRK